MTKKHLFILALGVLVGVPVLGVISSGLIFTGLRENSASPLTTKSRSQVGLTNSAPAMVMDAYNARDAKMEMAEIAPAKPASGIMPGVPFPGENGGFTPTADRTIIRTAFLSLLVENTRQTVDKVTAITQTVGGVITASNVTEDEFSKGVIQGQMTLRVPVAKLDETLAQIRPLAQKVTTENVTSSDKTEQKVDLDAQVTNLRATETQLQNILKQAKNVEETLEVQRELTTVRGQIERLQAQVDNLVGDAAMSTISLSISTKESELPIVEPATNSIWDEVKAAVRDTIRVYRRLFIAGIRLVILALPFILLAGVTFLVWKGRHRSSKK